MAEHSVLSRYRSRAEQQSTRPCDGIDTAGEFDLPISKRRYALSFELEAQGKATHISEFARRVLCRIKNVPGRKTDVKDACWLAQLLQHGLVQPSFLPSPEHRALRDMTRTRTSLLRIRTAWSTAFKRLWRMLTSSSRVWPQM